MFSKHDLLNQLESILDVSSLVEVEEGNYLIDNLNQFGFSLDYPEGITIYYRGEHFHLWKTPGDKVTTYDDILSNFKGYIERLLSNKILFIYTFRGKSLQELKL